MSSDGGLKELLDAATAHHRAKDPSAAEMYYRKVIGRYPHHPAAWFLLGMLYYETGRLSDGIEHVKRAVHLDPKNPIYQFNYGVLAAICGRPDEAIAAYTQAIRLNPDYPDAHLNLGVLLHERRDFAAARASFLETIKLRPNSAEAYYNLGTVLQDIEDLTGAREAYEAALRCEPGYYKAYNNLGVLSLLLSGIDGLKKAVAYYRQALTLRPDYSKARSNLLFALSYHVMCSPAQMLAEHRAWDEQHRVTRFAHARRGDPEKRLKVGYVSPDLRRHSVSYFFEPILKAHDRSQVEVYCYAEVGKPDEVTERLKGEADHWRSTVGLSDEAVARQIHEEGIDILIDLAGHTRRSRLAVFAYKPAPVQATYLGYFTTTGLEAMDYWITDEVLTPADTVERTTEEIWRLPRCCLVYQAPREAPAVVPRPAEGHVVFGSFNALSKVSDEAVALWSAVLRAVPGSRLLLKTRALDREAMCKEVTARFAAHGIEAKRLDLRGRTPGVAEHFASYGEVDIALDTIPRTGGTTTADALWMGVPVVSLAGPRFIERLSATMLTAVGLDELIAADCEDFVAKAVALARENKRRAELRADLRRRMVSSELCDGRGLAAALEAAYREMWRQYVRREA